MERLAKIERESRPITVHEVREKLRPKLPYWKRQLESSEKQLEEPKPTPPQAPEAPVSRSIVIADEDRELICEYPPRGPEPASSSLPQSAESTRRVGPRGGVSGPEPSVPRTQQRVGSPEPPSHHMQTGELVFSSDPAVARQQKELYSPHKPLGDSADEDAELSEGVTAPKTPELEQNLRDNIIRRGVYSFKIGRGKSDSAPEKDTAVAAGAGSGIAERWEERGARKEAESVGAVQHVSAEESVVKSTGEFEQDVPMDVPGGDPVSEDVQPPADPVVEPVPVFPVSEARIEPETGIVEGEPGEICDDEGDREEGGEGRGSDGQGQELEEGEMAAEERSEGEIEDDGPPEVTVGGKCYMDMEKEQR